MLYLVGLIALLAVVFGPAAWARLVMARHGDERSDLPGTGGELARHLLDEHGLGNVKVEVTDLGDHYDPTNKAVRLKRDNCEGRSLTAVVTAAHEVGHALQDRDEYPPLRTRTRLMRSTRTFQRIGSMIIAFTPVLAGVARSPVVVVAGVGAGILTMAVSVVIHLTTLPVELDASFKRALPILDHGGYLPKEDMPAARSILRACALTYVASSLAALLNLWRWIRFLR